MVKTSKSPDNSKDIQDRFTNTSQRFQNLREEIQKKIFGQEKVIELCLITLLSKGHVLLVGAPGLAKTRLVTTISETTGLTSKRIQCTPDLMPADIIGSEVLEEDAKGKRSFKFIKGPVFTNLLLADELNRASPRTQSALLQAMQENEVSIAGKTHKLSLPFHVLATQNPIEQDGTYPLPEAQLDRFLMQVDVPYPDEDAEKKLMTLTTHNEDTKVSKVLKPKDLTDAQDLIRMMPIGEKVVDAILKLVRNARPETTSHERIKKLIEWAPGPRASQALMVATRARALLDGRETPSIDDVVVLAYPVLQHRMNLSFAAQAESVSKQSLIEELCAGL